jgi:hypothetical protein
MFWVWQQLPVAWWPAARAHLYMPASCTHMLASHQPHMKMPRTAGCPYHSLNSATVVSACVSSSRKLAGLPLGPSQVLNRLNSVMYSASPVSAASARSQGGQRQQGNVCQGACAEASPTHRLCLVG